MSQLSSPAISIVVMAYNEAGNLEAVAKEIHAVLMSLRSEERRVGKECRL